LKVNGTRGFSDGLPAFDHHARSDWKSSPDNERATANPGKRVTTASYRNVSIGRDLDIRFALRVPQKIMN
jgi:hypothetical protein